MPENQKGQAFETIAHQALTRIAAIYHLDNELPNLKPDERKERRQSTIKPLVEAYFT